MQGRFYLLGHPCFSISLSQQPGTVKYTWSSFLDLGRFFGRQFFDRQGWGKVLGCFKCSPFIVHSFSIFFPLLAPLVKSLPAVQETWVQSLGREDLLKEMTSHSSILAWRIQWTEEPGGLQRVGHRWVTKHLFLVWFHQTHLRSSGIRSSRLGAPALILSFIFYTAPACFLPSSTCRTTYRVSLSVTKSLLPSLPFLWVPSPNWVSLISV